MWLQTDTWPQFSYSGLGTLEAMYESSELFNEGLLSFEYPIYRASSATGTRGVRKLFQRQSGPR